jgi:hypothetical protein
MMIMVQIYLYCTRSTWWWWYKYTCIVSYLHDDDGTNIPVLYQIYMMMMIHMYLYCSIFVPSSSCRSGTIQVYVYHNHLIRHQLLSSWYVFFLLLLTTKSHYWNIDVVFTEANCVYYFLLQKVLHYLYRYWKAIKMETLGTIFLSSEYTDVRDYKCCSCMIPDIMTIFDVRCKQESDVYMLQFIYVAMYNYETNPEHLYILRKEK